MSRHAYYLSNYNFSVPIKGGALLYNARTGALMRLKGKDAVLITRALSQGQMEVPEDIFPSEVVRQLAKGEFLIPREKNELLEIQNRYKKARSDTPIVLTITTTMDCNLGCYYCYEERSLSKLAVQDASAIATLARERLVKSGKHSLHIDWYGGEPLMNLEFLEAASLALQDLCKDLRVQYSASVISNGTLWPDELSSFIENHRIRQVQISFDGLRENHNKRRRFRPGYNVESQTSSFDLAFDLVSQLLNYVQVDIRLNIDRANREDMVPFIGLAFSQGWFHRPYRAIVQLARLASYSDRSSFMRDHELPLEEFNTLQATIRAAIPAEIPIENPETPDGFPTPKSSVCAALASDSLVIGADGAQYRCGLQVGESNRAVGTIRKTSRKELPVLTQSISDSYADSTWWKNFDPTILPSCSRCSFLPLCWGGCPKKHLEQDDHALTEQSIYWRNNLPSLIAESAGCDIIPGFRFTEKDQFRR